MAWISSGGIGRPLSSSLSSLNVRISLASRSLYRKLTNFLRVSAPLKLRKTSNLLGVKEAEEEEDVFELEADHRELVFQDESVLSDESSVVEDYAHHYQLVEEAEQSKTDSLASSVNEDDTETRSLRRSTRRQAQQQQQQQDNDEELSSSVLKKSLRSRVVTLDLNTSSSGSGAGKGVLTGSTRSNSRDILSELQL